MAQGRPASPQTVDRVRKLIQSESYRSGELTITAIAKRMNYSVQTIHRIRRQLRSKQP